MRLEEARRRIAARTDLNAFISLTAEPEPSNRGGEVVAVKDLVDVAGTVTTAGGTLLPSAPATEDAPLVTRLRAAGGVVVGKANLHEWAFGVTNNNPHYGPARNPHDTRRITGGSSGGSAAAVAAGLCDWAVGSDTGGSIRVPAGLCGVVGFKPTLGTVSTEGVWPLSRSLDTMGPLAPDVRSAARALDVMAGGAAFAVRDRDRVGDFRVAVPRGWFEDLDEPTRTTWAAVAVGITEIDFPGFAELGGPGTVILESEALTLHRRWVESTPESYGADVLANLRRGYDRSAIDYLEALDAQRRLRQEVAQAMEGWDALLVPATPRVAPLITDSEGVRPLLTRYTRPFNVTGQPVVTIPAPASGLPVGVQVIAAWGADALAARVAAAFEDAWGVSGRRP